MGIRNYIKKHVHSLSILFAGDIALKVEERLNLKFCEIENGIASQARLLDEAIDRSGIEISTAVSSIVDRNAENNLSIESRLSTIESALDVLLHEVRESRAIAQDDLSSLVARGQYANQEYMLNGMFRKPKRKRVLLAGWYGADNLGDEYMLQTVVQHLSGDTLNRVSVLIVDNFNYRRDHLDDRVELLHYPVSLWDIDFLVNEFDVLVWGGGALLDSRQYSQDPLNVSTGNLLIQLSKRMLDHGKDVYCLGLSSNAIVSDERYITLLNEIASKSRLFSLRDPYSYKALKDAGLNAGKMTLCEDIVYANDDLRLLKQRLSYEVGEGKPVIGIVLFSGFEDRFEQDRAVIASVEKLFSSKFTDYSIRLIPFYNESNSDVSYLRRIRESIASNENIEIARFEKQLKDTPIAGCQYLISGRYHAALISLVLGIKTIIVCDDNHPHYVNKMTHLANLFHCEDNLVFISDLAVCGCGLLEKMVNGQQSPSVDVGFLRSQYRWLAGVCSEIESCDQARKGETI